MKLEKIKNWKEIEKFLGKKLSKYVGENYMWLNKDYSCKHCNTYFKLIDYRRNLTETRYKNEMPTDKGDVSFKNTLNI